MPLVPAAAVGDGRMGIWCLSSGSYGGGSSCAMLGLLIPKVFG